MDSYRSSIAPRSINRMTNLNASLTSSTSSLYGTSTNATKNQAVAVIQENREKEKRELVKLNDQFASYVERVRFLEVYNKRLQMELAALKSRANSQTEKIREMYKNEIDMSKKLIDETSNERTSAETKSKKSEEEVESVKKVYHALLTTFNDEKTEIDEYYRKISEIDAEIALFRRRLNDIEDEAKRYKSDNQRLLSELQRLSADLDAEVLQRIQAEQTKKSLDDELTFLLQKHSHTLEDLKNSAQIGAGAIDSSQFFKTELANAIREIREEYDQTIANQRAEMEKWYYPKLQELQSKTKPVSLGPIYAREEAKKLRTLASEQRKEINQEKNRKAEIEQRIKEIEESLNNEQNKGQSIISEKEKEITRLRNHHTYLLSEYDELMKAKTNLNDEISTYRNLLEGDRDSLKQVIQGIEEKARKAITRPTL